MEKKREHKLKWKQFVFTPRGAERSTHGVKYGDDGYVHLCLRLHNGDLLPDYEVHTVGWRAHEGRRNVCIDWSGLKRALSKHEAAHQLKPSVFTGLYQHCKEGRELRQRMLHAICREYQHPEALANDLWDWMTQGKPEEAENLLQLLQLYWRQAHPSSNEDAPVDSHWAVKP